MARSLTTQSPSVESGQITVPSAAGFNAGDLVYYRNGDYGRVPDSAVSTATFVNTTAQPTALIPGTQGVENISQLYGSSTLKNAAVLTNGNIVQVFFCNKSVGGLTATFPYFQIVNASNTIVVSPTIVGGATYTASNYGQLGVIALSGGGFVVYGASDTGGTAQALFYAVYTNTGTVTTAIQQETTRTTLAGNIMVNAVALPNGGFVLTGLWSNSATISYRIYNSVGTALYPWTNSTAPNIAGGGGTSPNGYSIGIAARSDSSFIIVYSSNASLNAVAYFITSATNTAISSATISSGSSFTVSGGMTYLCDATTMSDGTTFVIAITGFTGESTTPQNSYITVYRKIPTGNVLGSEIVMPATLGYGDNSNRDAALSVKGLANNNLMVIYSNINGSLNYAVVNSSNQFLTGAFAKTFDSAVLTVGNATQVFIPAVIEVGSNVWVFYTAMSGGRTPSTLAFLKIDSTNFDLVASTPTVAQSTIVGNAPVSTYVLSGSTPSVAKFTTSISGSVSTTTSMGVAFGPSKVGVVDTSPSSGQYPQASTNTVPAVFYDGSFVIVTKSKLPPYKITANLYTAQGAFIREILVSGTSIPVASGTTVNVTTLTGGNFVVMWGLVNGTATDIQGSIFTKEGDFVASITTQSQWTVGTSQRRIGLAGISNNRFVLVGANSVNNDIAYAVYDSTGNQLVAQTNVGYTTGSASTDNSVYASPYGFVVSYKSASAAKFVSLYEASTNNFGTLFTYSVASSGANNIPVQSAIAGTAFAGFYPASATQISAFSFSLVGSAIKSYGMTFGDMNSYSTDCFASCAVPSGGIIAVGPNNSPTYALQFSYSPLGIPANGVSGYNAVQTFLLSVPFAQGAEGLASFQLRPLYGSYVLFTWNDDIGLPWFAIINAKSENVAVALVSGTTQSGNVGITPGTNGSGLTNYVFQGVATTSASAGGTGQVQTNGPALLNSSYSASTAAQSFDHQTPNGSGIPGNKGTIVGRSVTLLGNS